MSEIYDQELGEKQYFETALPESFIKLPITKEGYQALLARVCKELGIPYNFEMVNALTGFIHHLPLTESQTQLSAVSSALHKRLANVASWRMDQEEKKKYQALLQMQFEKDQAQAKEDAPAGLALVTEGEPVEQTESSSRASDGLVPAS